MTSDKKWTGGEITFCEDERQNPVIQWLNPWSGQRETVAMLFWPTHPPEETAAIEKQWEDFGNQFANAKRLYEALDRLLLWQRGHQKSTAQYLGEKYEMEFLKNGSLGVTRMLTEDAEAALAGARGEK